MVRSTLSRTSLPVNSRVSLTLLVTTRPMVPVGLLLVTKTMVRAPLANMPPWNPVSSTVLPSSPNRLHVSTKPIWRSKVCFPWLLPTPVIMTRSHPMTRYPSLAWLISSLESHWRCVLAILMEAVRMFLLTIHLMRVRLPGSRQVLHWMLWRKENKRRRKKIWHLLKHTHLKSKINK